MDKRSIGVFDSGLGGLTVLKELRKTLPNENYIYLGDTARVPYGNRSEETVIKFSEEDVNFLLKYDVKSIVVACNTASAFAVETLKKKINLPIFNVISSGSRMAIKSSKSKKIGIIATRGTIKSNAYLNAILHEDKNITVFQVAAPLLALLIEEGEIDGEIITLTIKKYLNSLKSADIDTLILGCTHYPIITALIQQIAGSEMKLINPGVGVAQEISEFLHKNNVENDNSSPGFVKYFVTDLNDNFIRVAEMFMQNPINSDIEKIELK